VGGFDYTINDSWYESYGTIYVAEIDGVSDWMYWVNYPDDPSPMVGSSACELADGDTVVWYHADSMESTPENTDMLIRIGVSITGTTVPGDVNHDGSVTTADAMLALRMAVGSVASSDAADVNRDGAVTSLDALMIRQAAAGANIA
ncbi:MAG: dockerin type I domain-containing protein, partial [Euryarchaeota archaeon]|nr:dockerin type I domain-containing protein [Euryarchaeota archaeon]